MCFILIDNDWIWTWVIWCQKWPPPALTRSLRVVFEKNVQKAKCYYYSVHIYLGKRWLDFKSKKEIDGADAKFVMKVFVSKKQISIFLSLYLSFILSLTQIVLIAENIVKN